jgi:S-DNA-T family DNA segregation ATPase FtsK/SpoIIIE
MGRKRRRESVLSRFEWQVSPETLREIAAVLIFVLGALFTLSIVGLAGSFGQGLKSLLFTLFGVIGYLLPPALILFSVFLWLTYVRVKGTMALGAILFLTFAPTLLPREWAGSVGGGLAGLFSNVFGTIGGYIISIGAVLVSLLLLSDTSLKSLFAKIRALIPKQAREPEVTTKASVFTTVTRRLGNFAPQTEGGAGEPARRDGEWQYPSIDLLESSSTQPNAGNIAKNVEVIEKTLKDFGIDVAMGEVNIGPTVAQYTLKPSEGVKLAAIVARQNDLALALAAHPIRIEAPIPGKSAVGIEVPNKSAAIVTLRELLESEEFKKQSSKSNLSLALGRDVAGTGITANLSTMPHLLIAGATGSGKSIALNSIITTFLYQNSPSDLRLILVDPKRVEFTHYSGIPHLLTPVVNDIDKTVNALRWAVSEMERRFKLFAESHKRDIDEYNRDGNLERVPYVVIIIDELADLMSQAANEVEAAIVRLAQMARATGIHLVVATQRPSVDVITGLIKANITSRIAFAVASQIDSRTIIDQAGAEKLLGRGDMLFQSNEFGKPKRIQGTYLSSVEVKRVTDFLKREGEAIYDESILNFHPQGATPGMRMEGADVSDELLSQAKDIVISAGKASASLLQRRLRVGYARAARLLDMLEQEGIVGPADGAKPRDVLITPQDEMKGLK